MAEFYHPERRIPYHADGTRVFYRKSEYRTFPYDYVTHLDYTEVPEVGKIHLNLERRGSLAFGQNGAASMNGAFPHYGAWEIVFFFARPMDITGIYFTSIRSALHSFVTAPEPMVEVPLLSASKDTTAIDDGDWSVGIPVPQSTSRIFTDTTEGGFATPENRRFFVWDLEDVVATGQVFNPRGADTMATYRGTYDADGYGVQMLYSDDFRGVRAMRITMPDVLIGGVYHPAAFGSRTNIHLYGTPTEEPDLWGVDIVNADSSELDANDLHFGDLEQPPTGTVTYTMPSFRVRNYSDTKTAENVTLTVTQPLDQRMFTSSFVAWATLMAYVEARVGGGAWQNTAAVTTDEIVLSLPDLSPGEESPIIEVRMRTANLTLAEWVQYGPGNLELLPEVGAWS